MKKYKGHDYNKVICIGWHKTGTTTFGEALLHLGFKVVGARLDLAEPLLKNDLSAVLSEAEKYDAFQDVPWAALYKELDKKFPGSKFILSTRNSQQWLTSAKKHFGSLNVSLHRWLYGVGVLTGNEEIYLKRYERHNEEVLMYFKNRPEDLLIVSLGNDQKGWEEICDFLQMPVPKMKFPHANKGKHNYKWNERLYNYLKNLIPGPLRRKIRSAAGVKDRRNRFNNYEENTNYMKNMTRD